MTKAESEGAQIGDHLADDIDEFPFWPEALLLHDKKSCVRLTKIDSCYSARCFHSMALT